MLKVLGNQPVTQNLKVVATLYLSQTASGLQIAI